MKSLSSAFEGKKALVTYIAAGDPDLKTTAYLLKLLDTEGAGRFWKWASPSPTPWRTVP
jgi:Tryptophan synthase alpha chain